MDLSLKSITSSPQNNILLPLCLSILLLPSSQSISDFTTLIYKNCSNYSNQTLMMTPNSLSQTISSLLQTLTTQSSNANFFKESTGDEQIFLSGLFQCRGDISRTNCHNCVVQLGNLSNSLCAEAVSARFHLHGCYLLYQPDEIPVKPKHELLHTACGRSEASAGAGGGGFHERDAALAALEEGVGRSGSGFYETRYESVRAMAQCQQDLWGCDCAECVGRAVEIAREECGAAAAGQVYLDGCYITFTWHPGDTKGDSGGKLVAIVLGSAAALGLGFVLFVIFKSFGKKDDDY